MAADSVVVPPTFNGDSVALTAGMIVRLSGPSNTVVRAQANTAGNVIGTIGVVISGSSAPGTSCLVACVGRKTVQMESGLTLAVGQTVYVSASVAGKGTNVVPGVVLPIGSIADFSAYTKNGTVEVDVIAASSVAGAGGTFPGFGGAPPAIAGTGAAGTAGTASRSDHTHAGLIDFGNPGSIGPNEPVNGVATTAMRSDALPGQKIQAAWPIANTRWYAVDGVNGVDAIGRGFSDVSAAAAGANACRTIGFFEFNLSSRWGRTSCRHNRCFRNVHRRSNVSPGTGRVCARQRERHSYPSQRWICSLRRKLCDGSLLRRDHRPWTQRDRI